MVVGDAIRVLVSLCWLSAVVVGVLTVTPACVEEKACEKEKRKLWRRVLMEKEKKECKRGEVDRKIITRTITGRETPLDFKNTSRPGQSVPMCSHSPTQMNHKNNDEVDTAFLLSFDPHHSAQDRKLNCLNGPCQYVPNVESTMHSKRYFLKVFSV